jgi:hypothetical protein
MGWMTEELGFEVQEIFLFSITSTPALGPTRPPTQWEPGGSSGGKAAGGETDHSLLSTAKVKTGGAIPHSPICLYGIVLNKLNPRITLPLYVIPAHLLQDVELKKSISILLTEPIIIVIVKS